MGATLCPQPPRFAYLQNMDNTNLLLILSGITTGNLLYYTKHKSEDARESHKGFVHFPCGRSLPYRALLRVAGQDLKENVRQPAQKTGLTCSLLVHLASPDSKTIGIAFVTIICCI